MAEPTKAKAERFFDEVEKKNVTVITLSDIELAHVANGVFLEFQRIATAKNGFPLALIKEVLALYDQTFAPLIEQLLKELEEKQVAVLEAKNRENKIVDFAEFAGNSDTKAN